MPNWNVELPREGAYALEVALEILRFVGSSHWPGQMEIKCRYHKNLPHCDIKVVIGPDIMAHHFKIHIHDNNASKYQGTVDFGKGSMLFSHHLNDYNQLQVIYHRPQLPK